MRNSRNGKYQLYEKIILAAFVHREMNEVTNLETYDKLIDNFEQLDMHYFRYHDLGFSLFLLPNKKYHKLKIPRSSYYNIVNQLTINGFLEREREAAPAHKMRFFLTKKGAIRCKSDTHS